MATQPSQPIGKGESLSTIDPYETLGLTHDATATQIKVAYRRLALRYHPDRCQSPTQQNSTNNSTFEDGSSQQQYSATNTNNNNKNEEDALKEATDKFARIAAAYATLSDVTKKKEYDHLYKLGAFDNNPNDNSNGKASASNTTPQTNNYRYTENLSGGYYKPGYKPPPQSQSTNSTHPFSNMAANFTPAQQQSFAKQAAEAAFSSMQSQDSFFDDLLYSPKSNIAQQHHDENDTTDEATAKGDATNNNSTTNQSQTKKKKQTGIGYSFKPIGKHLSIHVPSRNEIMLNMHLFYYLSRAHCSSNCMLIKIPMEICFKK